MHICISSISMKMSRFLPLFTFLYFYFVFFFLNTQGTNRWRLVSSRNLVRPKWSTATRSQPSAKLLAILNPKDFQSIFTFAFITIKWNWIFKRSFLSFSLKKFQYWIQIERKLIHNLQFKRKKKTVIWHLKKHVYGYHSKKNKWTFLHETGHFL